MTSVIGLCLQLPQEMTAHSCFQNSLGFLSSTAVTGKLFQNPMTLMARIFFLLSSLNIYSRSM